MMRYFSYLILAAIPLLISCENEPDNAPIITGTVKGHIEIEDCYGNNLDDLSGVQIAIESNTFSADTITDIQGDFQFDDVPFGKYNLTCTKENYVQQTGHAAFGHTGGGVATTVSEQLLGIPDFGYMIDSVESEYNCYKNVYVELIDATKVYVNNIYCVVMFFATTPDVDSENYEAFHIDVGGHPSGNAGRMNFFCCDQISATPAFSGLPIPFCYFDEDEEYLTLPKGKPSNVFAFKYIR
jgi:hypothetical protein